MSNVENPRGIDFPKIVSRLEWLSAGGRHTAPRTPMSISGITERLSNGTTSTTDSEAGVMPEEKLIAAMAT